MLKNTINNLLEKNNNIKSVKQSEIITYQPNTFENPNIVTEHPKAPHKLFKTIRQAEKVDSNSC